MPTTRYNKQQICGILLQFGAGAGSGGERGLQGSPDLPEHGESPGSHAALAGAFLFSSEKCRSPLFIGWLGCNSSDGLFYRGTISSQLFV